MHPDLGPLAFSMEVDLAAVDAVARDAVRDLGAWLPKSGRLLAFHGDRGSGVAETARGAEEEDLSDGAATRAARLVHLTERQEDCQVRQAPDGAVEHPVVELTGVVMPTWPAFESYAVGELMSELREAGQEDGIEDLDALDEALEAFRGTDPWHQVGGWAFPAEWQPEDLTGHPEDSGGVRSRLLLQIDLTPAPAVASAERDWDLDERLYWIARPEVLDVEAIVPDLDFFHQGG